MIPLLQFDYVNHRNEPHNYEVIPIELGFMRCKCFPTDPEKESWGMQAVCIRRDGISRVAIRSFAFVKMTNMQETSVETR
jgi:hypothetical protein